MKPTSLSKKTIHFLAFGFGSGLLPKMPGTFGTLVAIPIFFLLSFLSWYSYLVILLLMIGLGCYLCDVTQRDLQRKDDPRIVWDEICGFLVAMFLIPPSFFFILLGFIVFRFFDIVKPWPIGFLDQRVHGGVGVMLDDLIAGFYTLFILHGILFFISMRF